MGESIHPFSAAPFHAHVELLQLFLAHRADIVEKIAELLNAQRQPIQYLQDEPLLLRHFEDCFFTLGAVTRDQTRLRRQLEEAHWASGFRPRQSPGVHNDLVEPAEMMVRAFHLWRQTHWPGHSGRVRYANTLFNLHVIRSLALLSMRLWDAGANIAGGRLAQIQGLLDQLWKTNPADHPVLVRDARWLIPVAQSPTTDELAGYFDVAQKIAETFSEKDRLEINKAAVRMAGGHLRSQLRHISVQKGVSLGDADLVLSTRRSNALDIAMLIQSLVAVLEDYERATLSGDRQTKLELASTICQGISPDPELFLHRLDLLGPYSMIEHLFIATDHEGQAVYTPLGLRHLQLVQEYEARIRRLSKELYEDCHSFKPVDGAYSPYAALYGFSSNLIEHMAFKTLQPDAVTRFSLEDVFADGGADKRAWVSGWRRLPHITREMAKLFEYPQQFAEDIFARIEDALRRRVTEGEANAVRTGRLVLQDDARVSPIPDLPVEYIRSTDMQIAAAHKSVAYDQTQLSHERLEGEFVLSYKVSGGWVAITKDILTKVLGAGHDVKIVGLPRMAVAVLRLMCPKLVVLPGP